MQDEPTAHYQEIVSTASQLMSGYFQQPIRFSKIVQLSEPDRRNVILRLLLDSPCDKNSAELNIENNCNRQKNIRR